MPDNFFINTGVQNKKILIAPLDWGLGHATRCVVIIKNLQFLRCNITIAASGKIKKLLQNEFPDIPVLNLPGYNVSYSKNKRRLPFKILIQIPKILKIIRFEHNWLEKAINQYHFDAVISDNRYGLYNKQMPAVFITHQLLIKTNITWLDDVLQKLNYRYINHFTECWIPDFKEKLNIAGKLSHPEKLPKIPVKYIGPLSRFSKQDPVEKKYKWMAIISGPEPQRSLFEKKIFEIASILNESFLIVRGLPGNYETSPGLPNCKVFNHLNTNEMYAAIAASEFIISRCGYTTAMEMLALQKKSILIPTPGQTEQEHLANHLFKQNWCYCFNQDENFKLHLERALSFAYSLPYINTREYEEVLAQFVNTL